MEQQTNPLRFSEILQELLRAIRNSLEELSDFAGVFGFFIVISDFIESF